MINRSLLLAGGIVMMVLGIINHAISPKEVATPGHVEMYVGLGIFWIALSIRRLAK